MPNPLPHARDPYPVEYRMLHQRIQQIPLEAFQELWKQRFDMTEMSQLTSEFVFQNTGVRMDLGVNPALEPPTGLEPPPSDVFCPPDTYHNGNHRIIPAWGFYGQTTFESRARYIYFSTLLLDIINERN